jgi:hypothetical protein
MVWVPVLLTVVLVTAGVVWLIVSAEVADPPLPIPPCPPCPEIATAVEVDLELAMPTPVPTAVAVCPNAGVMLSAAMIEVPNSRFTLLSYARVRYWNRKREEYIRVQKDPANIAAPKKYPDTKQMPPKSKIAQNIRSIMLDRPCLISGYTMAYFRLLSKW